jgi:hypothetical protein
VRDQYAVQVDGLVRGSRHAHTGDILVTCMTAVRSDTTRYSEAAMDPVPESPPLAGRADVMPGGARGQPLSVTLRRT